MTDDDLVAAVTTRILLADLTPAQIAVLCNGCGPSGWKRHTWRWWLARWLTPGLDDECKQHDLDYVRGGTEDERIQADGWFRAGIARRARERPAVRWLLEDEQPILFGLVEKMGAEHFHHGEPLTLAQVRALADRRIAASN